MSVPNKTVASTASADSQAGTAMAWPPGSAGLAGWPSRTGLAGGPLVACTSASMIRQVRRAGPVRRCPAGAAVLWGPGHDVGFRPQDESLDLEPIARKQGPHFGPGQQVDVVRPGAGRIDVAALEADAGREAGD